MEQSESSSKTINSWIGWVPAAVFALLIAIASVGLGMRAMGMSAAGPPPSTLYQPSVYTGTVGFDLDFPILLITNTNTAMYLDIEARLESGMVVDTQTIPLGKIPFEPMSPITTTTWVWEGAYPEGAYQAVRMRVVIPEEAYLVFSPTTALEDSNLVYDGYYTEGIYFTGEIYCKFADSQEVSDERGFWVYGPLPTADETPEPTDTPDSPTNTPTITPWYNDCPPAPICSPTPSEPEPTLTPRPPWPTEPIPTCRPVATCPPWPTPLPTATYSPTLTPWPTQPSS